MDTVYYSLAEAGYRFPLPLPARSVYERVLRGLHGIRLESVISNDNLVTTDEAIGTFIRTSTERVGCIYGPPALISNAVIDSVGLYGQMLQLRKQKSRAPSRVKRSYMNDANNTNEYLDAVEAGKAFPKPIGWAAVLHRMKYGIDGVKLKCVFDGSRYCTTRAYIAEFLQEITEKRHRRYPVIEIPDEVEAARIKQLMEQLRNFGRKKRRKNSD